MESLESKKIMAMQKCIAIIFSTHKGSSLISKLRDNDDSEEMYMITSLMECVIAYNHLEPKELM